jgi:ABC-type polysaccharide/polyol phosphate transport system ATPase subunit
MLLAPFLITNIVQIFVKAKRIKDFLNLDEINDRKVGESKKYSIKIKNGNFEWKKTELKDGEKNFSLCDINLKIKKGDLIGIVGKVGFYKFKILGSGKSSLLESIIGFIILNSYRRNEYYIRLLKIN